MEGESSRDEIEEFVKLTNSTREQAQFFLEASGGDFDSAVIMYMDEQGRGADDEPNQRDEAGPSSSGPRHSDGNHAPQTRPGAANPVAALFQKTFQLAFRAAHVTLSTVGTLGGRLLPTSILHGIEAGFGSLSGHQQEPQEAAAQFREDFGAAYGEPGPEWQDFSWEDSSRQAHTQFKFLFVYLHSPHHQNTEVFCRDTLHNAELVHYVNSRFLSWGGDITKPDAYKLSQSLRAQSFPYTALLAFSGSRTRLIMAAEGLFPPAELLPLLQQAQDSQSASLVAEQAEQAEQNLNRRLREEQDAEYQRSLEADRERERQRQAADAAKEQARRAAEEEAAQARLAQKAEEERVAARKAGLTQRRRSKAATLGEEPALNSPGSVQIRVRLPDGRNFQRCFLATDPIQKAYDFVDSLDSLELDSYCLASSYPRRVFSGSMLTQSFQELGLTPQAMLFVQAVD